MDISGSRRGWDFRALLWAAPLGVALCTLGIGVWSWFISPVYLPVGSHTLGFGRSYTSKRPPPVWYRPRRMTAAIVGGTAKGRIFRVRRERYFVGWK